MRCVVNSEVVDCQSLYFRETNFGEPAPNVPQARYLLVATHDEFLAAIGEGYRELADDDRVYGKSLGDDDVFEAIRSLEWPDPAYLLKHQPLMLTKFVKEWLLLDSIEALFPLKDSKRDIRFVINSVETIDIDAEEVKFTGIVLLHLRDKQS